MANAEVAPKSTIKDEKKTRTRVTKEDKIRRGVDALIKDLRSLPIGTEQVERWIKAREEIERIKEDIRLIGLKEPMGFADTPASNSDPGLMSSDQNSTEPF